VVVKKQSRSPASDLPEGTVTFLFTDIEGSTKLLKQLGSKYADLISDHDKIIRDALDRWNGREVDTRGEEFFATFLKATEAVAASVEIQRAFARHPWPEEVLVRVRMSLHTGEPALVEKGYMGMDVHRAARIGGTGHGGQVLLSETTTPLIRDDLPAGVRLQDMGYHRLKDMRRPEHIHQLVIEGLTSEFEPLKSLEVIDVAISRPEQIAAEPFPDEKPIVIPHNLPVQSTPFVGREDELAALEEMLIDPQARLITIVGPGGMGKTRLALAAASHLLKASHNGQSKSEPRFPQGVFFVALADLESVVQILPAVNEALGFQPLTEDPTDRSAQQQLLDHLRTKRLMLVLDNYEQLLDGAGLPAALIKAAPDVQILVTSREKLSLRGERLYPLLGMQLPEDELNEGAALQELGENAAFRLFVQSAQRFQPNFTVKQAEMKDLARICQLVGGMPLALELAAGWVEMLSLSDIAAEISESIDFLETDLRDVPERHSSMTAVIEGTWNRLGRVEQALFKQLSVFRGGFTRQAARQVAGASIRQLASLAGKSLVQYSKDRDRYQIHRLLRQYGASILALESAVELETRDRHSSFFCEELKSWDQKLKGAEQLSALGEIEADSANVSEAWEHAAESGYVHQLDIGLDGMCRFYLWRRRFHEADRACRLAEEKLSMLPVADVANPDLCERRRVLTRILT